MTPCYISKQQQNFLLNTVFTLIARATEKEPSNTWLRKEIIGEGTLQQNRRESDKINFIVMSMLLLKLTDLLVGDNRRNFNKETSSNWMELQPVTSRGIRQISTERVRSRTFFSRTHVGEICGFTLSNPQIYC